MAQQTLTVCSQRLGVSLFTLRQWCERAHIDLEQQRSAADPRQKWLSDAQLEQLAQEHGRILDVAPPAPEPIPPNAYKLLMEQAARAQQEAEQIRVEYAPLSAGLAAVRDQAEQIEAAAQGLQQQITAIGQIQSATAAQLETLTAAGEAYRQELREGLDSMAVKQETAAAQLDQAMTIKLDRVAAANEQQQQQLRGTLDSMAAKQETAAATLETLIATSEERDRQLRVAQATLTAIQTAQTALSTASAAQGKQIEAIQGTQKALSTASAAQGKQIEKITSSIEEIKKQNQQDIERMKKSIQEEFQRDLSALRQATEKQARDIYGAIQSVKQDEVRDVQQLTKQIEESTSKSVTKMEAAEKLLAAFDQRSQAEQAERKRLLEQLAERSQPAQSQGTPPPQATAEKPRRGRRPKDQATTPQPL